MDEEYEPVQLSENTEVKVLYTNSDDVQESSNTKQDHEQSVKVSHLEQYDDTSNNSENSMLLDSMECGQDNKYFLRIFNTLTELYKELPTDLFVPRILKDYNCSESDLDGVRLLLFDSLKSYDDFPYGDDCELKKSFSWAR